MNVVLMLLTTVSAGDPGPIVSHPAPSSCGGSCGAVVDCDCAPVCCEKKKKCCFSFGRKKTCCPAPCDGCCGAVASCAPACEPTCCCEKPKKVRCKKVKCKNCCPAVCDSCGGGEVIHHGGHPIHPVAPGAPIHNAPAYPAAPANTIAPSAPIINSVPSGNVAPGTIISPAPSAPAIIPSKPAEQIQKLPADANKKGAMLMPTGGRIETESKNPF